MKKYLFFAAVASAALASCVTDESVDINQQNEKVKIGFDTPVLYSNVNARANVFGEIGEITQGAQTVTYPKDENFIIYAVQHETDFAGWESATACAFNGQSIAWDSDLDGWAPKNGNDYYYWPTNGTKLSFAASSPADLGNNATRTYDKKGITISDFSIVSEPDKQYDLLYSTRALNCEADDMLDGANNYSGIPIKFQHALSSIHFSLQKDAKEEVILKTIKLYGVYDTGTFKENITESSSNWTLYDKTPTTGNVQPAWTTSGDVVALNEAYTAFKGTVYFTSAAQYISTLLTDKTNYPNNEGTNYPLLLLPQTLTNNANLYVQYSVGGIEQEKTISLISHINEWKIGHKYTLRLVLSQSSLNDSKIYFSPATDGWIENNVIQIPL